MQSVAGLGDHRHLIGINVKPRHAERARGETVDGVGVRGQVSVCHVARIRKGAEQGVRNFVEDEGRPLEVGVQAQASNHLKLRGSRARVVSVEVKRRSATLSGRVSRDERK